MHENLPTDRTFNWRALLPVHPAAELFPLMSEAELRELADDIEKNLQRVLPVGWARDGQSLLDGRNRLDAMALLGLLYETDDHHVGVKKWTGTQWSDRPGGRIEFSQNFYDGDPYAIALSLNVHRRHLNAEQKRDLIAKLIKANPEKSNRQIAAQVKVASHPHIAKVRAELEKAGDVETVSTSIDTKGRKQPRRRASKPNSAIKAPEAKPNGKAQTSRTDMTVSTAVSMPTPAEAVTKAGTTLAPAIQSEWRKAIRAFEVLTSHTPAQVATAIAPADVSLVTEIANYFKKLVELTTRSTGNGEALAAGADPLIPANLDIPDFLLRRDVS
jgi:hypothetical protein